MGRSRASAPPMQPAAEESLCARAQKLKRQKNGKSRIRRHRAALYGEQGASGRNALRTMAKEKRIEGNRRPARPIRPRRHAHCASTLKRDANAAGRAQPAVPLYPDAGDVRRHHACAMRRWSQPRVLTLQEILQNYIDFQLDVITRRTRFDLTQGAKSGRISWRA